MEKILLDKKNNIDDIIEKIENRPNNELTLIIPKNSSLNKEDFVLLKKACTTLNKIIFIESVDEHILKLAAQNGFEAIHPLFNSKNSLLTDIKKPDEELNLKKQLKVEKETSHKPSHNYFDSHYQKHDDEQYKEEELALDREEEIEIKHKKHHKKFKKPFIFKIKFWKYVSLIAILGFVFWRGSLFFSKAEIILSFQKKPFEFNEIVSGNNNVADIDINKKILPVELFKNKYNMTLLFKASGKKNVSEKAKGEIIIYNNYSSSPQTLVANTRFEAPNGLIYRLANSVVVPGAQIKDGKIVPSSISAMVLADEPGEKYNTNAINKLTIPGFKGSPKYDGFYGELKNGATGGFIGEKAVPLDTDIEKAKKEIAEKLKSALESSILSKKPNDFSFIGNFKTDILKINIVSTSTDQAGNFAVWGEGETKIFGAREKDIINFLIQFYKQNTNKKINNLKIEYSNLNPNYENGNISFNLKASGSFVFNLDLDKFKNDIAGKSIKEAQNIIKNLEDFESAKILINPIWITSLPSNQSKINIILK